MDHGDVIREKMTERYLLDELDPERRDEFEQHYFNCPDCVNDVRAGSIFVEQSKVIFAEDGTTDPARAPISAGFGWFAWLRPAFTASALALLSVVVCYQNLVTYPRLKQAAERPHLLPWASLNLRTRGTNTPRISMPLGSSFLLFLNIPPDNNYLQYIVGLHNPDGKLEWTLTIPANPAVDTWPVQVSGADRESGTYLLEVRGTTVKGENQEIGRMSVELQIQK